MNKKSFFNNPGIGILVLRIFIGGRLFYGVFDNVVSWDAMLEFAHFLEQFNFPLPELSAFISVYLQFITALFILVGFKIRMASILMITNFIIAILFVHIKSNDNIENMTPALAMLFGCLTLLFTGAGKISLDILFFKKYHSNEQVLQ